MRSFKTAFILKLAVLLIPVLSLSLTSCGYLPFEQTSSEQASPADVFSALPAAVEAGEYPFEVTLRFAGDICLADNYVPMAFLAETETGALDEAIDPGYISLMNDADLMWINNEFCYSRRGAPFPGKTFTFIADPDNVKYLKELGVDIAGLANNHVFDYGEDALADTLDTISDAGIRYVGAGHDLDEARAPLYMEAGPLTIAYVAASRAEKSLVKTPQATGTEPGILQCYDNGLFLESIREAKENADYVVALPHWGTEQSTVLEDVQTEGARAYIDAGADAVIGSHPHVLQGLEYYQGRPVIYSLGNFWFDYYTMDTMVAELKLSGTMHGLNKPAKEDVKTELILYPGTQANDRTTMAQTPEEKDRIFRHLEEISVNVSIGPDGAVTEK